MKDEAPYDFIVTGAGCAVAGRLSEDGRFRVLLLEAGPRDTNPWIHIPLGYQKTSSIRASTGCPTASPSPNSTTGCSTSRAARCWVAPARSTAATPPTTTSGAGAAARAGPINRSCPTLSGRRIRSAERTPIMASAGRSKSATIAGSRAWRARCTTLRSRLASRPIPTSTARPRKASAITRSPSATRGDGRAPRPI